MCEYLIPWLAHSKSSIYGSYINMGLCSQESIIQKRRQMYQIMEAESGVLAQAVTTKYHRLGGLNNRNLFSHSSGGWKLRSGYQHGQMVKFWWEFSSCLWDSCLFAVSSLGRKLWCLFLFLLGHQFYWIRTPPLRLHLTFF